MSDDTATKYKPPVCWVVVDGRHFPLDEDEAWKIAWTLIEFCVERKQAERMAAIEATEV